MTRFLATAAAMTLAFGVSAVSAQEAMQTGVTGQSGNLDYPLQITASNGLVYNCKAEIENVGGQAQRTCVRANSGTGISENAAVAAAGGAVAIALIVANDSSSSTTTTN